MNSSHITWIFSIFNETKNPYFWSNFHYLSEKKQSLLVVDGGSHDGTKERLQEMGVRFTVLEQTSRGERFNSAIKNVTSRFVVFVHPRSLISDMAIQQLENLEEFQKWGAFSHRFDYEHPLLNFTSYWSNFVRGDIKGIFYLDHILWSRTELVHKVGGFPSAPIFEDTIFCQSMLKLSRPHRLPGVSVTSSIRFKQNGFFKQALLNQVAKLKFHHGSSMELIDKHYESGLELNRKQI